MSLDEKRDKQLPDIYLTEGICRSKSFAGLSHRRASSTDVTFSSSVLNFDAFSTDTLHNGLGNVLGQASSLSSARNFIHALSSSKSSKIHKSPHPQRTQIIFDYISKGLRDSIHLAQNDISTSRMAFDNVSVSSVMQMKANERLLKKLEFHLSKLEELKEQYDVQHRMQDGVRAMAYAYILSHGKEKDTALQNVKQQFKECTELLCSYESSFESLMGTFLFEMKGIQGFARICTGDVFEVVVKHGDQKWKSRGRVMKNNEQLWENKFILFKALFNEALCIKAVEVRGLGKNILLGNKFCEIHDLFSAHPQQMTINLNPSGSLKLNLIITWNPLRNAADGILASTLSSSSSFGRNSISQSSIQEAENLSELSIAKESFLRNVNFCDNTGQSFSSESTSASASAQSSAIASPDVEVMTRTCSTADNNLANCDSNSTAVSSLLRPKDANCNDSGLWSASVPMTVGSENDYINLSSSISDVQKNSVTEVLKNLLLIMEDIAESYPEVNEMSDILEEIEQILKNKNDSGSGSNISISVESALGCFDFLNSAIENEDFDNDKVSDDVPTLTDQKMDIHVDALDVQKVSSKFETSSLPYSSGNEEIDTILLDHLLYCTKLISALVTSGPMKHLEKYTLSRLKKQQLCLFQLLTILQRNTEIHINDFFDEAECTLKELWSIVAGTGFYCTVSQFLPEMKMIIKSKAVVDNYMASIVCPRMISAILDTDKFSSISHVTVLQFKFFFNGHDNPESVICEFTADSLAAEDLKCRDVQKAFAAVSVLSKITPSSYSLFLIGCLLIEKNSDLKNIASCYLKTVGSNEQQRTKIISSYLEMLLSGNVTPKIIACAALDVMEAKHCSEQLSIVANEDENISVREAASNVLCKFEKLSLGESSC